MVKFQITNNGDVLIKVPAQHFEVATQVLKALQGSILQQGVSEAPKTLQTVVSNIKKATGIPTSIKLKEPMTTVLSIAKMDSVAQASAIYNVVHAKQIEAGYKACSRKLAPFYTDLEAHFGVNLTSIHKECESMLRKGDVGKHPNRKIDTAIRLIGADSVYMFAKEYKYK